MEEVSLPGTQLYADFYIHSKKLIIDKKTKEKSLKLQGEKNVYEFLVANPSILSLLEQEIKQLT